MFISKMKSIELLFALASLASVAFTSITKETVEPYEGSGFTKKKIKEKILSN